MSTRPEGQASSHHEHRHVSGADTARAREGRAPDGHARLARVVEALLGALTTWEVARALATRGAAAVGATGAAICGGAPGELRLILAHGAHAGELVPLGRGATVSSGPLVEVHAAGEAAWIEGADALGRAFPGVRAAAGEVGAVACLPLATASGTVAGVLALEWTAPPDGEARAAAAALARLAAPALRRAERHDAVREARALAEAEAREARRHRRQQDQLMAVAGHDLRTPLQTVIMGARLLFQQGPLNASQAVTGARITRSAERAAGIIRDLLDLGRARQGLSVRIAPRPADLGALARAAVLELEQAHPGRLIICTVQGDASGVWDAGRLSRVVTNLAHNAVEHGGPRARVSVDVRGEAAAVRLSVHHDGPAVPPDRLALVLDPAGGHTGLGLAIVREIVRAHGGALTARSSPEAGTVFEVTLPRRAPAPAP